MSLLIKKHFKKLFTSDVEVLKTVDDTCILIIFKNGRTSCCKYATNNKLSFLGNQKIKNVNLINVFLRDPKERFMSGVNSYSIFNNIILNKEFLQDIEKFKLVDKHFVPQIFYLFHLYKLYKGKIKIHSLKDLKKYIPNHDKPHPSTTFTKKQKKLICSINCEEYIRDDLALIKKYMGKTVNLSKIVREFKYVLSAS